MKSVLLFTDLSVQSLWPIKRIVQQNNGVNALTIHVLHVIEIPTNISDLLFLNKKSQVALPTVFKDALGVLLNKNWGIDVQIKFDFIYANNHRTLNNFVFGLAIEQAYVLENFNYKFSDDKSLDFRPLLKKLKCPINYIEFEAGIVSEFQVLSIFLNNEILAPASATTMLFDTAIAV